MQKYTDLVLGQNGQTLLPIQGASVTVLTYPGGIPASIYSDNGITPTANPLTTDINGRYSFYAANGRYSIQVSYLTLTYTIPDFPLEDDPVNGQTVVITGGSIDNTPIGATTPSTGAFTNLSASGTLTGFVGRLLNIQEISATGVYTATTGTNSIIVELQAPGGGGGGSSATSTGQSACGTGGSSGAYALVRITSGFSGATVTLPAGGSGGAAGANAGATASAATFGSIVSCPGGIGGGTIAATSSATPVSPAAQTASPTVAGGTLIKSVNGVPGIPGLILVPGSSAMNGTGGNSLIGVGGAYRGSLGAGNVGSGFGSGGSGGNTPAASSAAQAGGNGAPAYCVVYEFS